MTNDILWQTKLAARIHDPAEKALVLFRDPAGHEGGSIVEIGQALGFDTHWVKRDKEGKVQTLKLKLPPDMEDDIEHADHWAAAGDRPNWPKQKITVTTEKGETKVLTVDESWAQVRWAKAPVLIHPLTGDRFDLGRFGGLLDTAIEDVKGRTTNHFSKLQAMLGESHDLRKALLTFWRFGSALDITDADTEDNSKLGKLWEILPADTRIPDHSIWDHLDLTSAFAGAFAADPDGEAALLALSIGPVQSFIAAARTTSDLWAGSHLLSRLSWEAMRPVCEELGPDAILFPRLRGIPQVDLWLRDQMELPDELFTDCVWNKGGTDANPLFAAALPNRFVAVVPASRAREIAESVEREVRKWLQELGEKVVIELLHVAGYSEVENIATPYQQMKEQLAGFPEVHWAAVPFSLIRPGNKQKQTDLDTSALSAAMAPFFGVEPGKPCGFLASHAWQVLQKDIIWGDNTTFFSPNPGVLYPAVYDLAERVLAAAKASRTFEQNKQEGWRDSLTGESECLTTDREQLKLPPGQRSDTLWTRIAATKPAWAKKGEHLGALSAIKRLWPTIFMDEVAGVTGKDMARFVVSTHTMALAHQLDQWLTNGGQSADGLDLDNAERVALPCKLMRHKNKEALDVAARLPGLLEAARDSEDDRIYEEARRQVRKTLAMGADKGEEIRLETYYSLIMMDGDRMGAILSGDDEATNTAISYRDSFHPQVQNGFDGHAAKQPMIRAYGQQKRPVSPNRHLAISGALNDFSQTVVRHVVEQEHLGRLIYAGGDDVLAMVPVADLLSTMQRLRHAYSGTVPADEAVDWGELRGRKKLVCKGGFAWLDGKLMRMMGKHATASCGAVIAHHQAPLGAVMRELRAAEKRAKNEGGRDAFAITVIKRSGGALLLTEKWGEPVSLLNDLMGFLRQEGVSRRAVYNSLEWLHDLPDPKGNPDMLASLLAYQLARQANEKSLKDQVPELARRLAALAASQSKDGLKWLANFISVAEFLARETRTGGEA
jgi:CRISPR-associated protein Cmr2